MTKEHPIAFSPAMVSAILDRRKFTTRRIIADAGDPGVAPGDLLWVKETHYRFGTWEPWPSSDGKARWRFEGGPASFDSPAARHGNRPRQGPPASDEDKRIARWYRRPAMFMFRRDCRLTLRVERVTTERLQEISLQAAQEEGIKAVSKDGRLRKFGIPDRDGEPGTDDEGWPWTEWEASSTAAFRRLWEKLHGAGSWEKNPRVAVYEFRIESAPGGSRS